MNIFALSNDPGEAARLQHDRHVVKMILESAQMLSACAHESPAYKALIPAQYHDSLYKPTHVNHPCNVWLRQGNDNIAWLTLHLEALLAEYHRRFQKTHKTYDLALGFYAAVCKMAGVERLWERDESRNLRHARDVVDMARHATPFAVCVPEDCKDVRGAVESYRTYYAADKIFQAHVKWTRCRTIPMFLMDRFLHDTTPQRIKDRIVQLVAENHSYNHPTPKPVAKPFRIAGLEAPSFLRRK